jgi:hypothetical protein
MVHQCVSLVLVIEILSTFRILNFLGHLNGWSQYCERIILKCHRRISVTEGRVRHFLQSLNLHHFNGYRLGPEYLHVEASWVRFQIWLLQVYCSSALHMSYLVRFSLSIAAWQIPRQFLELHFPRLCLDLMNGCF